MKSLTVHHIYWHFVPNPLNDGPRGISWEGRCSTLWLLVTPSIVVWLKCIYTGVLNMSPHCHYVSCVHMSLDSYEPLTRTDKTGWNSLCSVQPHRSQICEHKKRFDPSHRQLTSEAKVQVPATCNCERTVSQERGISLKSGTNLNFYSMVYWWQVAE